MRHDIAQFTDLEVFEEFVRRIKSQKYWNHYGIKISRDEDSDSVVYEFGMKDNTPETVGFMFGKESWSNNEIQRIWGSNPHWEWMKA